VVDLLGVPCALVCEGGAVVYDADGALLRQVALPLDAATAIAALADERGFPLATTLRGVNFYGPGMNPGLLNVYGKQVENSLAILSEAPSRMPSVAAAEGGVADAIERFVLAPSVLA
jgi:hydroxymethylpyrimidine pyrophosphatase-like HAD family hydrolase